jgi:hypothetical protein
VLRTVMTHDAEAITDELPAHRPGIPVTRRRAAGARRHAAIDGGRGRRRGSKGR